MGLKTKSKINIVWLKRDLRTQDQMSLFTAEQSKLAYVIIYLFEPSMIAYHDCSNRHLQFIYHSILEMNKTLAPYKKRVVMLYGEASDVFDDLLKTYAVNEVFSYQESGIKKTWNRDKQLAKLFKSNGVSWIQFQRDGILRGIKNRDRWDVNWYKTMSGSCIQNVYAQEMQHLDFDPINSKFSLPATLEKNLSKYPKSFQPAGEKNAFKYLASFTEGRGFKYSYFISKPTESRMSCGRISPYLAWGNISIKQAFQYVKTHPNFGKAKRSFAGFLTRLKWHCHFIQKFEVECEYETRCVNKGYENLAYKSDKTKILAWEEGKTGFPMIDANMRCLKETGWINFRMRAMLVSFFTHHLDQNWKDGVYHLAKLFLDYEPGIHYPQFQMQAGTTGVNTIRMYNPVKQALDHDPEAKFIKRWVPELEPLPTQFAHKTWEMTSMDQELLNFKLGENYPLPMLDLKTAAQYARNKIWGHRKNDLVRQEQKRILKLHTRRRKPQ